MSISTSRVAMQEAFSDYWAARTPVAWDNVKFKIDDQEFVRFSVQFSRGTQQTLGGTSNRTFRHFGVVIVQIFTKPNENSSTSDGYVQDVLDHFVTNVTGVTYRNPSVNTIGIFNGYYQQNVSVEFFIDQIK